MKILITLLFTFAFTTIACAKTPIKTDTKSTEATKETPSTKDFPKITIDTSEGSINLVLNREQAPNTVDNFIKYVKAGFYNGTIFHRVIKGFMIQGGGYDKDSNKKGTRTPIKNEGEANKEYRDKLLAAGKIMPDEVINKRGTIAMARTGEPHSATAQFFITHKDSGFLDYKTSTVQGWGYTVFGKIAEDADKAKSYKTLDKIAATNTQKDKPTKPIIIKKITLK